MRHLGVVVAVSVLAVGSGRTEDRVLKPLVEVDHMSIVCGCTFRETMSGAAEGSYGSGPELLVIAPNAEPPYALVNIGRGNTKLWPAKPIVFPMYQCEAGERFLTEWKSEDVAVLAKLEVTGSGEETCWFSGTVHVGVGARSAEAPVKGACGC
jgi:hypothetical protein